MSIVNFKQVFIINKDLKMNTGKIAVQVAHGETLYMDSLLKYSRNLSDLDKYNGVGLFLSGIREYDNWRDDTEDDKVGMMKKIVLKASELEMKELLIKLELTGINFFPIYDKGLTQIAPNSFTCIAVEPLSEQICDSLFKNFKLL